MEGALPENWPKKAAEKQKLYGQLLQRTPKNKLLPLLPDLHEEAFSKIDCLDCGNCCKGYSPRFKRTDIGRIARHLKIKEGEIITRYLKVDEDGDFVMQQQPCAFLGPDNRCAVYEVRPGDCARFPYTDEDVLFKRPKLTLKNATFCPAVYYVLERLIEKTGLK
jgi:Fe-S-cluster containining protein